MTITAGIILYAVIWFLVLFMVLPFRMVTQAEKGEVVPGTPEGAPHDARMGARLRITTIIATVLWVLVAAIILSGVVTIRDIDFWHQIPPEADGTGG